MSKTFSKLLILFLLVIAILGLLKVSFSIRQKLTAPAYDSQTGAKKTKSEVDQRMEDLANRHKNTSISQEIFEVSPSNFNDISDERNGFSFNYPSGRKIYTNNFTDHQGNMTEAIALCPEHGCNDSELAIEYLPGQDLQSWFLDENKSFVTSYWWNAPENYKVTLLPNISFMGSPGTGIRIECQDPSCMDVYSTDVLLAAIQTNSGVLEVRFNPSNKVHLNIIGSLRW